LSVRHVRPGSAPIIYRFKTGERTSTNGSGVAEVVVGLGVEVVLLVVRGVGLAVVFGAIGVPRLLAGVGLGFLVVGLLVVVEVEVVEALRVVVDAVMVVDLTEVTVEGVVEEVNVVGISSSGGGPESRIVSFSGTAVDVNARSRATATIYKQNTSNYSNDHFKTSFIKYKPLSYNIKAS